MVRGKRNGGHMLGDLGIVALSVLISVILVRTHALTQILTSSQELELIGSLIAGMFFTSVFTTAPAIATLGELSLVQPVIVTAIVGAVGSVVGDLLIFGFVKDRLSQDIFEIMRERGVFRRAAKLFRFRLFRWFTFLLGGLVIASPLPDELGIALLGLSKMSTRWFMALSFSFNFLGICLIGLAARMIAGI